MGDAIFRMAASELTLITFDFDQANYFAWNQQLTTNANLKTVAANLFMPKRRSEFGDQVEAFVGELYFEEGYPQALDLAKRLLETTDVYARMRVHGDFVRKTKVLPNPVLAELKI